MKTLMINPKIIDKNWYCLVSIFTNLPSLHPFSFHEMIFILVILTVHSVLLVCWLVVSITAFVDVSGTEVGQKVSESYHSIRLSTYY